MTLILCDKCDKYVPIEPDEDGVWSAGCKSPSVIDIFQNFFRYKKCKYYRKISYDKLIERCKFFLGIISTYSFHYKDKKYKKKMNKWIIKRIQMFMNDYLEHRDYLIEEFHEQILIETQANVGVT